MPCKFDTDVNAPAYAEFTLGKQAPSSTSCVYVTVGTGVGIGVVANKKTVHGLLHPEGGHVCIKRQEGDTFPGTCPFHGDCVEGLVSAAALAKRADVGMKELAGLADDDPVWDSAAHTLASLCVSMILIVSPDRIVLSGGIMQRACLFPMIHEKVLTMLNGYVRAPAWIIDAHAVATANLVAHNPTLVLLFGLVLLSVPAVPPLQLRPTRPPPQQHRNIHHRLHLGERRGACGRVGFGPAGIR